MIHNMSKRTQVDCTSEAKKTVIELAKALNLTNAETVDLLLSTYKKTTIVGLSTPKQDSKPTSANDRLYSLWLAIKEYNKTATRPFYGFSAYWLQQQTYINSRRDIAPFFATIKADMDKHYKELKVSNLDELPDWLKEKDANGQNPLFQQLIKDSGLSDLFVSRKAK